MQRCLTAGQIAWAVFVVAMLGGVWLPSAAGDVTIPYSGMWHFDEGSGVVALDSSGHGCNGAISGATWTTDSRTGAAALQFDGTSASVATADLDLTGSMTVWASVKVTGATRDGQVIVSKWNPGSGGNYELGLTQDLRPYFQVGFSGSGNWALSSTPLTPGTWYDLVGTYDGVALRIFVNGEQAAYAAISGHVDQNDLITTIGASATLGAEEDLRPFRGIIDEVAIAGGAQGGGGEPDPISLPPDPISFPPSVWPYSVSGLQWHFDEGTGTTAYDSTGTQCPGTINGATWTTDSRSGPSALDCTSGVAELGDIDLPNWMTVWASVRVNGPGVGQGQAIGSKWIPGSGGNYELGLTDLYPYFQIGFSGSGNWALSDEPLTPGVWYDLVGTYDGAVTRIYVNGEQKGCWAMAGDIDQNDLTTTVGATPQGIYPFNGIIDEVGIAPGVYAGALSPFSFSSFEEARVPWSAFADGGADTFVWRTPLSGSPAAASGLYVSEAAAGSDGISGLRLDLPVDSGAPDLVAVSVTARLYVAARAPDTGSAFVGFGLGESTLDAAAELAQAAVWEFPSDTTSRWRVAGVTDPSGPGLPEGAWHEIRLVYSPWHRQRLIAWMDGIFVGEHQFIGGDGPPAYSVLLGARGVGAGGSARVYFDDVQVMLYGSPHPAATHAFALLGGPEAVAAGQESIYRVTYGNGYPMLGLADGETPLSGHMYVAARLPDGYSYQSADPAPLRSDGNSLIWEVPRYAPQRTGLILLRAITPTDVVETAARHLDCWVTEDPAVAAGDPAAGAWGEAYDILPQRIDLTPEPDVYIKKQGPAYAAPGDPINYVLTVTNVGSSSIADVMVKDRMPEALGGGEAIVDTLPSLVPGEWWTGTVSSTLPLGLSEGTLVLNQALVPSSAPEADFGNNISDWVTTIQPSMISSVSGRLMAPLPAAPGDASARSAISVSPEGVVTPGQSLTYTLECENVGTGNAYGVFMTMQLDPALDPVSLLLSGIGAGAVKLDTDASTLVWEIGRLGPGEQARIAFKVNVSASADPRSIVGRATVYFPSASEETPTNVVINQIRGAGFSASPVSGAKPLTVNFTDLSTNAPTSWNWSFGDGGSSAERHPSHTYTEVGVYTVSLTATGAEGADTKTRPGYIRVLFTDAGEGNWAINSILACVKAGIVGGYPDGTYRPTLPVTRDQMAVFVSRALAGGDSHVPTGPVTAAFSDVPTTYWAFKYVEYARSHGVVGGYSDGTYRPTLPVTRDQMAVFVARAMAGGDSGVPPGPGTASFPDVPPSFWAFRYVEYIKTGGVTGGYPDGTYRPTEAVTRDQMAVYVQRAFSLPL